MTQVRILSDADRNLLAQAWATLRSCRFPGSGEELDDDLAEALSFEMLAQDSALAGAVDTLLAHGATERRYLEVSERFAHLLVRARARSDASPDLLRVIAYGDELERVRELALELAG